jgi:hypothetical protein
MFGDFLRNVLRFPRRFKLILVMITNKKDDL